MSGWRHAALGSAIDRETRLRFTFDGQRVEAFAGDTLASALLASGHRILGRSFKYHRPRGLWGFGAEEPNAVFDVTHAGAHMPNVRAPLMAVRDGMAVRSVNAVPNARWDLGAGLDLAQRFLPAGFYYKTFMRLPWRCYEPLIRRMAGLGRVDPTYAPPADCAQVSAACDVLVIGAGPAGLAAARAAAEAGQAVWLVEEAAQPGGALRWRGGQVAGTDWSAYAEQARSAIEAAGGRVLLDTTLWGAFDHGTFAAWQRGAREVHWRITARRCILASGALERPVWFAKNDLPGVMSAEAALHMLALYGVVPGRRILLATGSDASAPVARALHAAGAQVTIIDIRPDAPDIDGIALRRGARVVAAHGLRGVTGATVNGRFMDCDTILCAGGVTPTVHLWCQAGGKLDWDAHRDMLVPRPGSAPMTVVGAARGTLNLSTAVEEGRAAGAGEPVRAAPSFATTTPATPAPAPATPAPAPAPAARAAPPPVPGDASPTTAPFRPDPDLPGRQWVDFQNDVTLKDVALAAREGFTSVEHLKRYTTLGMATDQGRVSNFGGLAAMAALTGRTIPETGTTTYRPPFQPVPLRSLAGPARGALYHPLKRLPLEDAHRSAGARFRDYGGWLRPAVYGAGDEQALAAQEAAMARRSVALYDASPLGKLEVIGPGAAALLDFTGYIAMSDLPPGRARYGLMLSENGIVYDDGVVMRLAPDHFVLSASSSHVEGVRLKLEDGRQDRIGRAQVFVHDVTQGFTTLSVTGPKARALCDAAGLTLPHLPHMGVGHVPFEGGSLRVARVSFTGDQSFELTVPNALAGRLKDRLEAALPGTGGGWIGLEAVMILRAEKGFIVIGKDTDGLTMPQDLGWGGPRAKRTDEYIGKRSLFTAEARSPTRRQLVGLRVPDGGTPIVIGAHLIPVEGRRRSLGFVTSAHVSPTLNRPIALALLEGGRDRIGTTVRLFNDGEVREATVCPPCAFDPTGERLHG